MRKRIVSFLLGLLLLQTLVLSAGAAHPVPDVRKGGSITVSMRFGSEVLRGGSLTFYRVASIREDNGNYSLALTEEFADSEADLEDLDSPELARELAEYAKKEKCIGETRNIVGGMAHLTLDAGKLGLYLVVQQEACTGYEKVDPFLITVPSQVNGEYDYTVEAAPKMEKPKPKPTPDPEPDPKPVPPVTPGKPVLPQTGQLNWPIPVLAAAGLILFTAGWLLRRRGRKERDRA